MYITLYSLLRLAMYLFALIVILNNVVNVGILPPPLPLLEMYMGEAPCPPVLLPIIAMYCLIAGVSDVFVCVAYGALSHCPESILVYDLYMYGKWKVLLLYTYGQGLCKLYLRPGVELQGVIWINCMIMCVYMSFTERANGR